MDKKENFKKMLLNDNYITWLSNFMKNAKDIDNIYFICMSEINITDNDIKMLEYLESLYVELRTYYTNNNEIKSNIQTFCMKYKNNYYVLQYNNDCCSCKVYNAPLFIDNENSWYYTNNCFEHLKPFPYIEYEDLKKQYSIEEKAVANNVKISSITDIINKIIECPREFYINISKSLTLEERKFLIKELENKSCLNCTNESCMIESQEKIGLDENGNLQGSKCNDWENHQLIGKSKILKMTDIHKL